jgi:transposase InsO family protein
MSLTSNLQIVSSVSRELISWVHSLTQKAAHTSWLSSTVFKWVETLPCQAADAMHSKRMFHEVIFLSYEVPRIVIGDGGSHFIFWIFRKALTEVGVDHRTATLYHPQTSGQAETSNKQIKNIRQKTVNQMGRSWKSFQCLLTRTFSVTTAAVTAVLTQPRAEFNGSP